MSRHYRDLFASVHEHPTMFGLDGSYATATAFVEGCDAGNEWGLLNGFEEWLIPQIDGQRNHGWPSLVLRFAFPDGAPQPWEATDEQRAFETLFRLLDEFLAARGAAHVHERRAIFGTYFEWERERFPRSS